MDPTTLQQIFTVFYAILYGVMLNSLVGLFAFPVGRAFSGLKEYKKSKRRLLSSFCILNLAPFAYFIFIFSSITNIKLNNLYVFYILFLGLGVFAFYRLYIGFIITYENYLFDEADEKIINKLKKRRTLFWKARPHLIASFLYFIPLLLFILLYTIPSLIF